MFSRIAEGKSPAIPGKGHKGSSSFLKKRTKKLLLCWLTWSARPQRTEESAGDLVTDHHLNIWDAMIFAAAAEAGCDVLLSEDMQDGFLWGGVRVISPFQPGGWAQLQALVGE